MSQDFQKQIQSKGRHTMTTHSDQRPDGGPAFPEPIRGQIAGQTNILDLAGGMTLRDYFAAKAMQGMNPHPVNEHPKDVARWAYEIADAMIAERSK